MRLKINYLEEVIDFQTLWITLNEGTNHLENQRLEDIPLGDGLSL